MSTHSERRSYPSRMGVANEAPRPLGKAEQKRSVPFSTIEGTPPAGPLRPPGGKTLKLSGRFLLRIFSFSRRQLGFILGYGLYFLLLIVIFFCLTFPYQKLEGLLVAMLEQALSSEIEVRESRWDFPLGLDWSGVLLQPRTGFKGGVVVDRASAKVYVLPLFRRHVEMEFLVEAYGGKIRGNVSIQQGDGKAQYYFQESAQDLELRAMGLDLPFDLSGRLKLDLEATWQDQDILHGSGTGSLELLNFQTQKGSVGGWEVPALSFGKAAASLTLKNGMVSAEGFNAQGPDLEASGQGTLLIRDPLSEGLLNVALRVSVKEALREKFPVLAMMGDQRNPVEISVKGTLRRPLISVNGVPVNL